MLADCTKLLRTDAPWGHASAGPPGTPVRFWYFHRYHDSHRLGPPSRPHDPTPPGSLQPCRLQAVPDLPRPLMYGGSRQNRECQTDGEEDAPLVHLAARPPGAGAPRRAGRAAVHAKQQCRHDGQLVSPSGIDLLFFRRVSYPWLLQKPFKDSVGERTGGVISSSHIQKWLSKITLANLSSEVT